MTVKLRCPVRGCGEALNRGGVRWACARNHSFDQHRHGFLNLLQPQDRRSSHPGDSKEAAQARRRLAALGHADEVHHALAHAIHSRSGMTRVSVLDVGCGEGAFLRSLGGLSTPELHGVDLSAPSIDLAARAQPGAFFIVANADRALPYGDSSFDHITSVDSRVHAAEFERVLAKDGLVLVAVPAPDDLVELRERVQGARREVPRASRVVEQLAPHFTLADRTLVRETRTLERDALRDLLTSTYRGFRRSEREAVDSLGPMRVTLSHEVMAFQLRLDPGRRRDDGGRVSSSTDLVRAGH